MKLNKDINFSHFDYLLQLSCGYWKSQVLFTAVGFDIFTLISSGKVTAKEISQSIHTDERATEMLLNALVSLELLEKHENRYDNSHISSVYLVKGMPYYQGDIIHYFHSMMDNWAMLRETVETGRAVSPENLPEEVDPNGLRGFITAMHNIASVKAEEICNKIDLESSLSLIIGKKLCQ